MYRNCLRVDGHFLGARTGATVDIGLVCAVLKSHSKRSDMFWLNPKPPQFGATPLSKIP